MRFFFYWLAGFVFVVFLFVNHVVRAVDMISCFVYFFSCLVYYAVFLFFRCSFYPYRPACLAVVGYLFFLFDIRPGVLAVLFYAFCVVALSLFRDIRPVCVCCGARRQFIYVFLLSLFCALVFSCSSLLVIV